MRRHWFPCRVCGKTHENPRSSSICPSCGQAEAERNAERRAEAEAQERREAANRYTIRMNAIPEDALEAYWEMERDFNHETVCDFMIAMLETRP